MEEATKIFKNYIVIVNFSKTTAPDKQYNINPGHTAATKLADFLNNIKGVKYTKRAFNSPDTRTLGIFFTSCLSAKTMLELIENPNQRQGFHEEPGKIKGAIITWEDEVIIAEAGGDSATTENLLDARGWLRLSA